MTYDQKKYIKEYYQKHKERIKTRSKKHYLANRERIIARVSANKNPEKERQYRAKKRYVVIKAIFDLLGYECELCGEKDKHVLQIDHINGGGRQHSKSTHASISRYYKVILKSIQDEEKKYRTLCANCNIREGIRKKYRSSVWDFPSGEFL